eukprot:355608-Pleurochrysis_carterae.AAC.4
MHDKRPPMHGELSGACGRVSAPGCARACVPAREEAEEVVKHNMARGGALQQATARTCTFEASKRSGGMVHANAYVVRARIYFVRIACEIRAAAGPYKEMSDAAKDRRSSSSKSAARPDEPQSRFTQR